MKKVEIALIIGVAIIIAVIFSYTLQGSQIGNFTQAFEKGGKTFRISGTLNKNIPVESPQPNLVIFNMFDSKGKECKIYLNQTVPEHFDKTDKVTITGKADNEKNAFYATEVQAKCPSKYNDEK